MAYAFDRELAPSVADLPALDLASPAVVRATIEELVRGMPAYEPPLPLSVEDLAAPGRDGAPDVPVRVFAPRDRVLRAPGLVFLHGGGFVFGSVETEHAGAAEMAAELRAVVVSVDYRLAPEHPFPAGVEDCYAALEWTASRAGDLGVDLARLGVVGESAGGGLAAALALLARDRGGPALCFQCLRIPALDDRLDTPSMREFVDTPVWNRPNAELSWRHYLGASEPGSDGISPYAAPARATDLSGLPPAYVSTCEFDPLRDEGILYAHRLVQAGVRTELHHYPGTFHGSQLIVDAGVSQRMHADLLAALRRGLGA